MLQKIDLRKQLTFGFEQTFTIPDWWTEPGFITISDTPKKREAMLALSIELAKELKGKYFESKDIWNHMQYEVTNETGETQFYVTMDPGSIEVKTPPCLVHETQKMAEPLFIAAERANVVAYRNWWYGVQAGTEGGCHVNMGGMNPDTNPLKANPELVVKYAAYIHNRPFLHHPFMGVDVGPEGNAMRMDEKKGFDEVKEKFSEYREIYKSGKSLGAQETYNFFEKTNLISEKSSYPSLYKFKEDLFFIEDRAQESLRCAEDFYLVSELRVQILELLATQEVPEDLKSFDNLHSDGLTSFSLWEDFCHWVKNFRLEEQKFRRFFDRQFPELKSGNNIPEKIFVRDGRRPRVITDIQKRGEVVISKTIDTHYKRLEIYTDEKDAEFKIKAEGIEEVSKAKVDKITGSYFCYLDLKYSEEKPVIEIKLLRNDQVLESGNFNIHNMMWD